MAAIYKFKPYNVGRWVIWSLFALVLLAAPLVFTSNLSVTMLAQMRSTRAWALTWPFTHSMP